METNLVIVNSGERKWFSDSHIYDCDCDCVSVSVCLSIHGGENKGFQVVYWSDCNLYEKFSYHNTNTKHWEQANFLWVSYTAIWHLCTFMIV